VAVGAQPPIPTTQRKTLRCRQLKTRRTGQSVGFRLEDPGRARTMKISAGALSGAELPEPRTGSYLPAIADGIGGAKGGRIAAETAGARLPGWIFAICPRPMEVATRPGGPKFISAPQRLDQYHGGAQDPQASPEWVARWTALVLRGARHRPHLPPRSGIRARPIGSAGEPHDLPHHRTMCAKTALGRSHTAQTGALGVEVESAPRLYDATGGRWHGPFSCCAVTGRARVSDGTGHRRHLARTPPLPRIPAGCVGSGPPSNQEAPTIAPPWFLDCGHIAVGRGSADISAAILQTADNSGAGFAARRSMDLPLKGADLRWARLHATLFGAQERNRGAAWLP